MILPLTSSTSLLSLLDRRLIPLAVDAWIHVYPLMFDVGKAAIMTRYCPGLNEHGLYVHFCGDRSTLLLVHPVALSLHQRYQDRK